MRPGVTGHKGRKGKQEQFPAANGLESSTGVGGPEHFLHCSAGHSVTCLARFRSQTSNRRVFFLSSSTLCCARILFGKLFSLVVLPQASEKDVSQFQPPPVPGDGGKKKTCEHLGAGERRVWCVPTAVGRHRIPPNSCCSHGTSLKTQDRAVLLVIYHVLKVFFPAENTSEIAL